MNVQRGDVVMVDWIYRIRGKLSAALVLKVDACLKAALDVR